jgi:hypothetical protein
MPYGQCTKLRGKYICTPESVLSSCPGFIPGSPDSFRRIPEISRQEYENKGFTETHVAFSAGLPTYFSDI